MKTKALTLCIAMLVAVSAWADEVYTFSVYEDCSKNGYEAGISPAPASVQAVDLGLPSGIKWASCNVGATQPEDYGNYYAWGEVVPKDDYSWETYKYANGSSSTLTKYCNNASYGDNGFTDGKTTLDLEDDVAHVNWGGNWCMPRSAEIDELRNNCTWKWTIKNGINGYQVTSNTNSNSIFLPAAGSCYYTNIDNFGSYGYYWSLSLDKLLPYGACNLTDVLGSLSRCRGLSVRPVCPSTSTASTSSSYVTLTLYADGCESANVIHCNVGQQIKVTAVPNTNGKFSQWSDGNTDTPRLVTITEDVVLTAEFADDSVVTVVSADTISAHAAQKLIHNGHVYILRNGNTYTLTGEDVKYAW